MEGLICNIHKTWTYDAGHRKSAVLFTA